MTKMWVTLDVRTLVEAEERMAQLIPHRHFKVGLELYHRIGPAGVLAWTKRGYSIFLDVKLHDIPRTVSAAMINIQDLGVELVTVHIGGGFRMLEAAQAASGSIQLLGVTVLTSLDQMDLFHLGYHKPVTDMVIDYAKMAKKSGLSGVVVSAQEVAAACEVWPEARLAVPGIRWPGDDLGDQQRVGDPAATLRAGATDLVLGRGLWESDDPSGRLKDLVNLKLGSGPQDGR